MTIRLPVKRRNGFTLIELTIVLVLVGVIAVVAVPRFQPAESTAAMQADRLARDLRHMQMLAITWGVPLRLNAAAAAYSVSCVSGPTPPCNGVATITDPATNTPFNVSLQNGVTVGATTLNVDILGRPITGAGALLTAGTVFALTGGSKTPSVTMSPLTGFITVAY
jgi:MSHA pilin protein MshC